MMGILKDRSLITPDYPSKLAVYLLQVGPQFFRKENEADSWDDFCRWNTPCDRTHLIMPGEVCLIDRNYKGEHWYMICYFTKAGKVVDYAPVIKIDGMKYGSWRNGYFLLPDFKEHKV